MRCGAPLVLLLAAALCGLAGCGGPPAITACASAGDVEVVCDFRNPEDLAVIGDGEVVLISEMGDGEADGRLSAYHPGTGHRSSLFDGSRPARIADGDNWADPACAPPRIFAPHGLDVRRRADGRLQLLVVNHGDRETVEFFEVWPAGLRTRLQWRGCVQAPSAARFDDVVLLSRGGFLATRSMARNAAVSSLVQGLFGTATGWVVEWRHDTGFREVPGTRSPLPRGLEVSEDERYLYLNVWIGNEVRKIERATGRLVAHRAVPMPENSTWDSDGRLLVVSHVGGLGAALRCDPSAPRGNCGLAWDVLSLDPDSLEGHVIHGNEGPPMGAATVARRVGERLVLGTFAGDRIAFVTPLARAPGRQPGRSTVAAPNARTTAAAEP